VNFPGAGVLVENPAKPMREKSALKLLVRHREFRREQVRSNLMTDINVGEVQFVAFILYGFLNSDAKSLIVCIFRCTAMTTNHLFTILDPNQPFRLVGIPRNFHTICTHRYLRPRFIRDYNAGQYL
jgi:hypothetical protein